MRERCHVPKERRFERVERLETGHAVRNGDRARDDLLQDEAALFHVTADRFRQLDRDGVQHDLGLHLRLAEHLIVEGDVVERQDDRTADLHEQITADLVFWDIRWDIDFTRQHFRLGHVDGTDHPFSYFQFSAQLVEGEAERVLVLNPPFGVGILRQLDGGAPFEDALFDHGPVDAERIEREVRDRSFLYSPAHASFPLQ